jgi:glycosyltransferase involved in cell wall biosynthesis
MPRRIFIHANNVHQGGGRSLLLALLKAVSGKLDWAATLDARLKLPTGSLGEGQIKWVTRSVVGRLNSEWWLMRNVQVDDVLLCFGNLPPLFRSRGRVMVFVQNRYLIEPLSLEGHSISVKLRICIERWWLLKRILNVDLFIVQTPTMKSLLQSRIAPGRSVAVLPFVGTKEGYSRAGGISTQPEVRYDFLYVASGEPHKNHRNLIEAWCLLAAAGLFPSLCLTIDESASLDLCQWLRRKTSQFGLKVENLGSIPHEKVQMLYRQTRAFVFASTFESLGLPLIEARQAGLPVLAPELDYVRDVLDPQEVFDPASPVSIARAVNRFMGTNEEPLPLLDASGFVDAILSSGGRAFPA